MRLPVGWKPLFLLSLLGIGAGLTALSIFLWLVFVVGMYRLPSITSYSEYRPQQTSYFLDRTGQTIGCVANEWRDVMLPDNPKQILVAHIILAMEDRRFYERDLWVDVRAIGRAAWENFRHGKIVEGGSTIPQQLVKRLLPPDEQKDRSYTRKAKEFLLAKTLVTHLSKDEIFTLYLNEIYLGNQRYGIEAASKHYFNKAAQDLSLSEASTLAALIPAPSAYSPRKFPNLATEKRNEVLKKLLDDRLIPGITSEDIQKALSEPLAISDEFDISCGRAPHAVDHARDILRQEKKIFFDEARANDAWRGISVFLTIDAELQRLADEGLIHALALYRDRQKEHATDADGAVYIMDNATGGILAVVGSSNYAKNKRNNALNGERQPGSAFKTIVYTALFEEELLDGESPDSLLAKPISNSRISCKKKTKPVNPDDWWRPENFDDEKYNKGSYTRAFAIAKSINRPAIHAARAGGCGLHPRIGALARRLGITRTLQPYLPTALGASEIPLNELVRAYSVFPNYGHLREPYIIEYARRQTGSEFFRRKDTFESRLVFKRDIAEKLSRVMIGALRGAVEVGTAYSLSGIKQPIAAKTGTTNDYADAMIIGFTPEISFGVWVGNPRGRIPLGDRETGGTTAAPAARYMLERWYANRGAISYPHESAEWDSIRNDPSMFEKELREHETEKDENTNK